MTTITFRTADNYATFLSMAEGMWTNARDDNDAVELDLLDAVINELAIKELAHGGQYPMTLPLRDALVETAEAVLDNCLDNSGRHAGDDEDDEDDLAPDDVEIKRG